MKKIITLSTLAIILISLASCGQAIKNRQFHILPITFGIGPEETLDKDIIDSANEVLKEDLHIEIIADRMYTSTENIEFDCLPFLPPIEIDTTNLINQCYDNLIIVVFVKRIQSTNLLGCGHYKGILNQESLVIFYVEDDLANNSMVLVHELGHIFGAPHIDDGGIMTSTRSNTKSTHFSDKSKEQINSVLTLLDMMKSGKFPM